MESHDPLSHSKSTLPSRCLIDMQYVMIQNDDLMTRRIVESEHVQPTLDHHEKAFVGNDHKPNLSKDMDSFVRDQQDNLLKAQLLASLQRELSYRTHSSTRSHRFLQMPRQHSQWRPKICEWCYRVVDHFEFDRQVVYISMEYFDRFLCLYPGTSDLSSRMYQLAAMTCLYMAMKIHADSIRQHHTHDGTDTTEDDFSSANPQEFRRRCVRLSAYVELSRGQFYPNDIERMERIVLQTLDWRVNPVTPMCFVSYFLMIIPSTPSWSLKRISLQTKDEDRHTPFDCDSKELVLHVLHELSRYLAELAIICLPGLAFSSSSTSSSLTNTDSFKPSLIAYAAILLSMDVISLHSDLSEPVRREFLEELSRLSSVVSSDSVIAHPFSHNQRHISFLHQNHPDVLRLKQIIQDSFIPEMILEQAFSISSKPNGSVTTKPSTVATPLSSSRSLYSYSPEGHLRVAQIHPILIAKEAGILNLQYIKSIPTASSLIINEQPVNMVFEQEVKRQGELGKAYSPTSIVKGPSRT